MIVFSETKSISQIKVTWAPLHIALCGILLCVLLHTPTHTNIQCILSYSSEYAVYITMGGTVFKKWFLKEI